MSDDPPVPAGPDQGGDPPRRDQRGRFPPGVSGNRRGRPAGRRAGLAGALDNMAEGEAERVLQAVIDRAGRGDMQAAETILRRLWPAPRGARVAVAMPPVSDAKSAAVAAGVVVAEVAAGHLAPEDGQAVLGLLEGAVRLAALDDMERRLAALEGKAGVIRP